MKIFKKLIIIAFIVLAFSSLLTACAVQQNSYKLVAESIDSFVQYVNYRTEGKSTGLFEVDSNLSYNQTAKNEIENNPVYSELKTEYEASVKIIMNYVLNNYKVFNIQPKNEITSEMETSYKKVEEDVGKLKDKYNSFIDAKNSFEQSISDFSVNGAVMGQKLIEFKRKFAELIDACANMFNSYSTAYRLTYENTENFDLERIGEYYFAKVTIIYDKYAINEFNGLYFEGKISLNKGELIEFIKYDLGQNLDSSSDEEKIKRIREFAVVYEKEALLVLEALENLNLRDILSDFNGNLENYLESSTINKVYYKKLQTFFGNSINNTVSMLKTFIYDIKNYSPVV